MKNIHSLFHLFKEKRLVWKEKSPEYKQASEHFGEGPIDTIESKKEKLAATRQLLNDTEKVKNTALSTVTRLGRESGGTIDTRAMVISMVELASQVYPGGSALQRKQTIDFIKAFEESEAANIKEIDEDFVIFTKDASAEQIKIFSSKDGKEKGKELGSFDIKSKIRKEIETKREAVMAEITEEENHLTEEQTNVGALQGKAETYGTDLVNALGLDPLAIEKTEEEMNPGISPHKIEFTIYKLNAVGERISKAALITLTYQDGKFGYIAKGPSIKQEENKEIESDKPIVPGFLLIGDYLRSWESGLEKREPSKAEQAGREFVGIVKVDKEDKYVYVDTDEQDKPKFYFADDTEITGKDLEIIVDLKGEDIDSALERVKEKKLAQQVEAEPAAETEAEEEKTPAVAVEKIKDKIVKKIEITQDPKTNLRTLTITTKRGTILIYREIGARTPDNQAIWQYSNTDEYYLDSGKRIGANGYAYEGDGQKESTIIGQHVRVQRDLEKDFEERLEERAGARVALSSATCKRISGGTIGPSERLLISQGPKAVESQLDFIFRLVEEKLENGDKNPEYTTLKGITQTIKMVGETLKGPLIAYDKIEINFHGIKVEWTKENGFVKPDDHKHLTVKTIQILKAFLGEESYEKFMAQEETLKEDESLQESVKKAEDGWRKDCLAKLNNSYSISGFKDRSMSEEDIVDNWFLLDGTTRITDLLTKKFLTKGDGSHGMSEHEVPQMAGKMISEWGNEKIDFKEVFKFVTPNLQGFDNTDKKTLRAIVGNDDATIKQYLTDPINVMEVLARGMKAKNINEIELNIFLDKIFNKVVNPTIDLLESMANLRFSDAKKEKQPDTAEGMISKLMEEEKYSDFTLKAGNRFTLDQVSEGNLVDSVKKTLNEDRTTRDLAEYVDKIDNKLFLQAVFGLVSPENLVRQGCLEKNRNGEIRLVKLPEELDKAPLYILGKVSSIIDGKESEEEVAKWKDSSDRDILQNKLELIDRQEKVLKQLKLLCKVGDDRNWLKKIVDNCKGVDEFVYLTQLDGTTLLQNRSKLNQQMTEEAALNTILYNGKYYDVDQVRGFKTFKIESLQADVNKFIEIGLLQKYLTGGKPGKSPTQEEIDKALKPDSEFNKKLAALRVGNLETDKISSDQIEAFQLGLIVDYNARYEKQMDTLPMPKNLALRGFLEWAISTGADLSKIKAAQSKLLLVAGANIDMGGNVSRVGLGGSIDLGNGFSLDLGVATNFEGVDGIVGTTYTFKGPGESTWKIGVAFVYGTSGTGTFVGAANIHRYGKTRYEGMVLAGGLFHSSTAFIPIPAIAYGWKVNQEYAVQIETEENIKDDNFKELETALQAVDSRAEGATENLLKIAKKYPQFKVLSTYKIGGTLPLSDDMIVSLIRLRWQELKNQAGANASKSLAQTDWIP
ncbi:MAG: hypothetical protein WC604_04740, partial [Candidatus Gracilibacteria bacterium]